MTENNELEGDAESFENMLDFQSITQHRSFVLEKTLALYNAGNYFLAHEILEEQWKKEEGAFKIYLHALIQICLSLVKVYEKPNEKGSRDQSQRACSKLDTLLHSGYLTALGETEISRLLTSVGQLHHDLLAKKDPNCIIIPMITTTWEPFFRHHGNH